MLIKWYTWNFFPFERSWKKLFSIEKDYILEIFQIMHD